jgi:hypothetical protein
MLPSNTSFRPIQAESIAANETAVMMEGEAEISLKIGKQQFTLTVWLSKQVKEFLLGYDWLSSVECTWNFGQKRFVLNGEEVPLHTSKKLSCFRILYCRGQTLIPAHSQCVVPIYSNVRHLLEGQGLAGWVVEPKILGKDVMTARMALCDTNGNVGLLVGNFGDRPYTVRIGTGLGRAEQVATERVMRIEAGSRTMDLLNCSTEIEAESGERTEACKNEPFPIPVEATMGESAVPETTVSCGLPHIEKMVGKLPDDLTAVQKERVRSLLYEFAGSFSKDQYDVGHTDLLTHAIDTGNSQPVRETLRRHAQTHLEFIDAEVEKLLQMGIVSPSMSPWASNIVLVTKKGGQLRLCVDYRRVNAVTRQDSYPIPRVDACLDVLGNSTIYSSLDLRSGYWQCGIREEDKDKTTFLTRRGAFRFNVLPFGLCNAVSLFQRLQDKILAGLNWFVCLVYLDDIAVFSSGFDEHLMRLRLVFMRMREAGLKFNPEKCRLFQRQMVFLGYLINKDGVRPDVEKVEAVRTWPEPKNVTEVRTWIGLLSYYRRWIEGFSRRVKPLFDLLKKDKYFVWGEEQQQAFEDLKNCLMTAPILALPIDAGEYVVDCDASGAAAGSVLSQWQKGELRVIAYASRTFRGAEKRYTTNQRELSAVIFGLKQFRVYVLGRPFLLRSDHSSLRYLMTTKEVGTIQGRHLDFLAQFKGMRIEHRSGAVHRNADALSRRPNLSGDLNELSTPIDSPKNIGQIMKVLLVNGGDRDAEGGISISNRKRMGRAGRLRALKIKGESIFIRTLNAVLDNVKESEMGRMHECTGTLELAAAVTTRRQAAQAKDVGNNGNCVSDNSSEPASSEVAEPMDVETYNASINNRPPSEFLIFSAEEAIELITKIDILSEQKADLTLSEIVRLKNNVTTDRAEMLSPAVDDCVEFKKIWVRLQLENELLTLKTEDEDKSLVVIPRKLRQAYASICHLESGHQGQFKTAERFARRFYFPGWREVVKTVCVECPTCASYCKGVPPRQGEMRLMEVDLPMQRLSLDLVGPNPVTPRRNVYILTVVDSFSRYLWTMPLRNKLATGVMVALHQRIFSIWGLCREFHSDQGGEVHNELMSAICTEYGIRKTRTSPYRASSNGRVERTHRTIHSILAKTVRDDQGNWDLILPAVTLAYNRNVHESTNCTPISLMTGREALMPIDLGATKKPKVLTAAGPKGYRDYLQLHLRRTFDEARKRSLRLAKLRKERYDRKVRPVGFDEGTKVVTS